MNKYHPQNKLFVPFVRFIRHDAFFDDSTGMHGDDIAEGIKKQNKELAALPHPVRKAKAFQYMSRQAGQND